MAKKMDGKKPKLRTKWVDFGKRELLVTKVENGKVHGQITFSPTGKTKDIITRDYSCDLKIFEHIWMRQTAPADPVAMANNSKEAIH